MRNKLTKVAPNIWIILSLTLFGVSQMCAQIEEDSTKESQGEVEDLVGYDSTYVLKLEKNGKDFIGHFKMTKILGGDDDYDRLQYFIELRNYSDSSLFQTVVDTVLFYLSVNFELVDINLDGVLDIKFVTGSEPAYGDDFYRFWIYNRKKNNYYLNEEYSQIRGEYEIDRKNKVISCSYRENCSMCTTEVLYKISNDHLKLIERESTELIKQDEDGYKQYKKTIEKLVKGKLKVVKTITTD